MEFGSTYTVITSLYTCVATLHISPTTTIYNSVNQCNIIHIRIFCNKYARGRNARYSHKGSRDKRADPICGPSPVLPVCEGGSLEALDESTQLESRAHGTGLRTKPNEAVGAQCHPPVTEFAPFLILGEVESSSMSLCFLSTEGWLDPQLLQCSFSATRG